MYIYIYQLKEYLHEVEMNILIIARMLRTNLGSLAMAMEAVVVE
jgi:hypothetical protein